VSNENEFPKHYLRHRFFGFLQPHHPLRRGDRREFDARLYVCHVIDLSAVTIYGEFQLDPVGQQLRIQQELRSIYPKYRGWTG